MMRRCRHVRSASARREPRPRPPTARSMPSIDYVKAQYKEQFNLVWLDQITDERSQALAVTKQFSEETTSRRSRNWSRSPRRSN